MKRTWLKIIVVGSLVCFLIPVYFLYAPLKSHFFPPCPFYTLTGFYCPGCGTQRAIHALLHGRLMQAAGFNLLALVALPFIFYSAAVLLANTLLQQGYAQSLFYRPWFAKSVLALVLLFWILRNLPLSCFQWLAP